jgi:lambda family phage portal protein
LDRTKTGRTAEGGAIVQGVEINAIGRVVAYWIRTQAPGDLLGGLSFASVRIPAADIVHVYRPLFPGQMRGLSWFAPILLPAHELAQVLDAMLVRAKVAALMTAFVKNQEEDAGFPVAGETRDGETAVELEPGAIIDLPPGQSVEFSEPPDQGSVGTFATETLRIIAAGAGVTYEQLSGDYSKVTYSSARQAILEFRRFAESVQHHTIVFQLCRPVWDRFVRWQVLIGAVPATAYQRDQANFLAVKWLPPAWPWVDPLKDAQAAILEMNNLLRSRSEIAAERGADIESLDAEIAADRARADRLGIAPIAASATPIISKDPADA